MSRLTRAEVRVERALRAARDVAVLGASARPGRGGNAVVAYLKAQGLLLVVDRDIRIEHRHTEQVAGQPRKRGVNVGGRRQLYEDDRKRRNEGGYVPGGGGGRKGGGGSHAVLDEKKMVGGRPSPRRGPLRRPE